MNEKFPYCLARGDWPNLERCRRLDEHKGDCRFYGKEEQAAKEAALLATAVKKTETSKKTSYQIPFDKKGNMVRYLHDPYITEWRDPEPFSDGISFQRFVRGRSAAYAVFESARQGPATTYSVFLKDLSEMIPHMRESFLEGTFIHCKKGQNFGVKLLEVER
jgi:hypothetical protein